VLPGLSSVFIRRRLCWCPLGDPQRGRRELDDPGMPRCC